MMIGKVIEEAYLLIIATPPGKEGENVDTTAYSTQAD
jgi:hypothetical protein